MAIALVQMGWHFDLVRVVDVSGHVRLRHGDRLQLHADVDVDVGVDGAEPEPDGDVVAVFERGPLSQGDLRRAAGPSPLGTFFTYFVPILVVVNVPANAMVRVLDPKAVMVAITAAAVLLWLSRRFFQYALRSYRSASS